MPALTALVNDIHNKIEKPTENALKSDPLVYQFIIIDEVMLNVLGCRLTY